MYKILFNPWHLHWNVTMSSILVITAMLKPRARVTRSGKRDVPVNNEGSSLYVNCNDIIKAVNCCYGYLYPKGDRPYQQTLLERVFRSFFLSLSSFSKHKSHYGSWWAREDKETYIPWLVGSVIEESGPAGACPFCGNEPPAGGHASSRD